MGSGQILATGQNVPALAALVSKPETDPATIQNQGTEEIHVLETLRTHSFVKFHRVQVHC